MYIHEAIKARDADHPLDWLKDLRTAKGLSCRAVGRAVGVTQQHYSFIESGKRKPSVPVAKKIAAVLGFDWTRLYEETDVERIQDGA